MELHLIRHSISEGNDFFKQYGYNATEQKYKDTRLSKNGIANIEFYKHRINKIVNECDLILVSPLKRTIQTCFYSLNSINKPLFLCSLVAEINDPDIIIENFGTPIDSLLYDHDVCTLPNIQRLIVDNAIASYFYNSGGNKWYNYDSNVMSNKHARLNSFTKMLNEIHEVGYRKIVIFTHYNFIKSLTGYKPNNLDVVRFNVNIDVNNSIKKYRKKNMNILSYNIFWKSAMQNNSLLNIIKTIDHYGYYDFVGLQEATNWKIIKQNSFYLSKMNQIHTKSGKEKLVLFYDDLFKLDKNNVIKGELKLGRPFIVAFFGEKLCVITLHAGHNKNIYEFNQILEKILDDKIKERLKNSNVILLGDLNDTIENGFDLLGMKLYGRTRSKTCCNLKYNKMNYAFDHILSTQKHKLTENLTQFHPASDHNPIKTTIN